jgi:hypothetical protein
MQEIAIWASLVIATASLAFSVYNARSKRFHLLEVRLGAVELLANLKVGTTELLSLDARVDLLEDRATRLEGCFEHLPDKDVTHRLELSIQNLRSELSVLSERMKPIGAIADRVQEVMLEKARI